MTEISFPVSFRRAAMLGMCMFGILGSVRGEEAEWVWTGAYDGESLYRTANWSERTEGGVAPPGTIKGGSPIDGQFLVEGGTPGGSGGITSNLIFTENGSLEIKGGVFRFNIWAGLKGGELRIHGGRVIARFLADGCATTITGGELELSGPGNPMNPATMDLSSEGKGRVVFLNETPQDVRVEHLAKFTIGGEAAVEGENIYLVSDGAVGCIVTAYPDSDGDGMDDTWEIASFGDLSMGGDGDGDGDGLVNLDEFLTLRDPGGFDLLLAGEAGSLRVTQSSPEQWHRVEFQGTYRDPVVVMGPASRWVGFSPASARVRNVNSTGFEYQLSEWAGADGITVQVQVGWMVVEAGTHELAGGRILQAGHAPVQQAGEDVVFDQAFATTPVILTQVASWHGYYMCSDRITAQSPVGFSLQLQNHEYAALHANAERVDWIAVDGGAWRETSGPVAAGTAQNSVDHFWRNVALPSGHFSYAEPPEVVIAGGTSMNEGDPVFLRYQDLFPGSLRLLLEEDRSADTETAHAKETASWLVLREGVFGIRPTPADLDGDGLPDAWESTHGLDPTSADGDNGFYGDPDGDRLHNRGEYLAGTDPRNPDSDGDGVDDRTEIEDYGSDPSVADVAPPVPVLAVPLAEVAGGTTTWQACPDGSLVANARRGSGDFNILLEESGVHILRLTVAPGGIAAGQPSLMPVRVLIDGVPVGQRVIQSLDGGSVSVEWRTPWLATGHHTVSVVHDNYRYGLALSILSLDILRPAGVDEDADGQADWLALAMARENAVTRCPAESLVSPVCLEGVATHLSAFSILLEDASQAAVPMQGPDSTWFANLELTPDAPVVIEAQFEGGTLASQHTILWRETDVLSCGDLTIRKGDSLRLTGLMGVEPANAHSIHVDLSIDGVEIDSFKAPNPHLHTFEQAGDYTVSVHCYKGVQEQDAAITVTVLEADFGNELPLLLARPRAWEIPGVSGDLPVQADSRLIFTELEAPATGQAFQVESREVATRYLLARLPDDGPVLARGSVQSYDVAGTSMTGSPTVIHTYPDGDRLVRMNMGISGLPPGGYVMVRIFVGGVTFTDGTVEKMFTAEDFDANGMTTVDFNYPATALTSVCHRISLHDANGTLIGEL